MIKTQAQEFEEEICSVIQKWANKIRDDRLTYIEMIGVLNMQMHNLNNHADTQNKEQK